ncbi:MAG: lipoate--protein ligase family protein [Pedosphaera sp.]|nr:lipoate--protein ligase family protein [Pedosphaera sp.]MST01089.1 lipoate--protein ligase family protein [Pedosphaera sp.]
MAETWLLLQSGEGAAAFNMALDEALLEHATQFGAPVLRFYGWMESAASFGYSQRFADVIGATQLRPLVRRSTGGGLVPHDADWTYSLVFPPSHSWAELSASESYRRAHEWIRAAFTRLSVETKLSSCCRKELPGQCFVGAEKYDVLWRGRKIAGAAQRRNRSGLLIQGSVQPPPLQLAKADWQKAMCDAAVFDGNVKWEPFTPDGELNERAEELARTKYSLATYNERR